MNEVERPLASPTSVSMAQEIFAEGLSPEEYAARNAHYWLCFSQDDYRYEDLALDAWIARLGDIFFHRNGAPTVKELREKYLTPEERARAEQREKQEF
jgi:hypothetical protein